MKTDIPHADSKENSASLMTELLILEDGQILVHNLTPSFARLLMEMDPTNELMKQRAQESATLPLP